MIENGDWRHIGYQTEYKGLLTVKTYPDQNVPKSKHNHWNLEWKSKCTHDFCSFLSFIFVNYWYKLCFQS